ncbi:hypothetical protein BJV77DRAFT_774309 [Russula vinacea]|nr:hypothetical protein BJV77DRAFT_774309 [Russula vinacea]
MAHEDRERGINTDDDLTQPVLNRPRLGEPCFCDSSGPFFSIYSKAAEEEDRNMVECWQKDADGILIFSGLFSAAVAALLAVTVLDPRINSQDTSASYLGNTMGFFWYFSQSYRTLAQIFIRPASLSESRIDLRSLIGTQLGPFTSARERPHILMDRPQHVLDCNSDIWRVATCPNCDKPWISLVVLRL